MMKKLVKENMKYNKKMISMSVFFMSLFTSHTPILSMEEENFKNENDLLKKAVENKALGDITQQQWRAAVQSQRARDQLVYNDFMIELGSMPPAQNSLESYLLLEESVLFTNYFVNAVRNLQIRALIEKEKRESVLRSIRHIVQKIQDNGWVKNSKERAELSDLKNAVDLRLGV